jgi:endonuclease I
MNLIEFRRTAGGTYHSTKHWKHLSSEDKHKRFWSFHRSNYGKSFSIYAGVSIATLLREKQYSIEHIVPRSYIDSHLSNCTTEIQYGATINPFNLVASHKRINARRGSASFDFDEDLVKKSYCTRFSSVHNNQIGFDNQGEWIVPYRSRGDIARAILYMHLIYPLPSLPTSEVETLIKWGKMDQPSNWERKYCNWIQSHMQITNPIINNPKIIKDESLFTAITIDD